MYYWVTIINWNFFNPILRSRVHCHYYLLYITIIVIITINDYIHMYCYNYYIPYYIYYYYYYLFIIIIVIDIIIAFSCARARLVSACVRLVAGVQVFGAEAQWRVNRAEVEQYSLMTWSWALFSLKHHQTKRAWAVPSPSLSSTPSRPPPSCHPCSPRPCSSWRMELLWLSSIWTRATLRKWKPLVCDAPHAALIASRPSLVFPPPRPEYARLFFFFFSFQPGHRSLFMGLFIALELKHEGSLKKMF